MEVYEIMHLSSESLKSKIYSIRGYRVMVDRDLAELYNIPTKRLKEQVRRNLNRFPKDFMFELTKEEFQNWRSQIATSNSEKMGLRLAPFVFTEHGVLMLSSVLKSEQALKVNIQIMRTFIKMREMIFEHKDLLLKIQQIENQISEQGDEIKIIFSQLKRLAYKSIPPRKKIGFHTKD